MQVVNVKHLVGYDVSNYLVSVLQGDKTITKYIIKVHKNISDHDYKLLQIQNAFLQYLNNSNKNIKYNQFPKPVKHRKTTKKDSIKSLHTDKLIMYDL